MAAFASAPAFTGVKLSGTSSVSLFPRSVKAVRASPVASLAGDFGKAAVAVGASLILAASSASAAEIKLGADDGSHKFVPESTSIVAGETIIFVNNSGSNNVIFDEKNVPEGVNAYVLSHYGPLTGDYEQFVVTLTDKGTYKFYCDTYTGEQMTGEIVVKDDWLKDEMNMKYE